MKLDHVRAMQIGRSVLIHTLIALAVTQMGWSTTSQAAHLACVASIAKKASFTKAYGKDDAYEVRIAAAEFLAEHGPGSGSKTVIADLEAAAFLKGVVENRLTDAQAKELPHYSELLANLVRSSKIVERLRIFVSYNAPENKPTSISQLLVPIVPTTEVPKDAKPGFFARLRRNTKPAKPEVEFLNAEQFSRALESYPPENRLEALRRVSAHLPRLTHLEVFRILMSLPVETQIDANVLLEPQLIGRLDVFPLEMIEKSVTRIELPVIAGHLRATGGNYELHDLLAFLRANGMNDMQILNTIPQDAVRESALTRILDDHAKMDLKEALFFLHLGLPTLNSAQELDQYTEKIKERLDDPNSSHASILQNAALQLAEAANFLSRSEINPQVTLFDSDIDYMQREERVMLEVSDNHQSSIQSVLFSLKLFRGNRGDIWRHFDNSRGNMAKTATSRKLGFFHAIQKRTGRRAAKLLEAKDYIEHDRISLRCMTDALHAMGFDYSDTSIALAWAMLHKLSGQTATLKEIYELRAQILRLSTRPGLHEISPQKQSDTGLSLADLKSVLFSTLDDIRIQQ